MSISAIDNSFEERLDEKKHRPKTVKRGAPKKNEDRKKCNRQVESEKLTAEKSVLETNHGISEAKVRSEKKTQEIFEEECLDEDDDIHSLSMEV